MYLEAFSWWAAEQDQVVCLGICVCPGPQLRTRLIQVPPAQRYILEAIERDVCVELVTPPTHFHMHNLDIETQRKWLQTQSNTPMLCMLKEWEVSELANDSSTFLTPKDSETSTCVAPKNNICPSPILFVLMSRVVFHLPLLMSACVLFCQACCFSDVHILGRSATLYGPQQWDTQ